VPLAETPEPDSRVNQYPKNHADIYTPSFPTLNGHSETFWQIVKNNPDDLPSQIANKFYGETNRTIDGKQVKALIAQGPPPDPFALTTANEIF